MSVDSFIQARVSVDTGSEHSAPHLHASLRPADPPVDPRWQMILPTGAGAEHAYLESIASELGESERQAIQSATPASSVPSRIMSDSEDSHSPGGSRRQSMLRNRLKHGKTSSSTNRSAASGPIGSSSIGSAYSQNTTGSSAMGGSTTAVDSRSSLSTTSQSATNNTRRPAVSSSGLPVLPTSPLPPLPATPSVTATLPTPGAQVPLGSAAAAPTGTGPGSGPAIAALNRRANPPGPINVARQRTLSLGGTAASSSAANLPATAPLRLATDELPPTPDESEYCIAFVGSKGCGKSALIRKVRKVYPNIEITTFQVGEHTIHSTLLGVNITTTIRPVRVLEVDSTVVAYPGNLWPQELPRVDGVLLCYDASNEDSYTRIPELVAGYHELGHAVVILACKSDLHKVVSPSRADNAGKPYEVGLVEVSAVTDAGKKKLRACFHWEIKAIGRHRRAGQQTIGPHRNPASPDILQSSRPPWDNSRMPTAPPSLTQSSSSSSIAPPRHPNNSAPALPHVDTHSVPNQSMPSTARTSIDSVLGASSTTTPMTPSRRRSPSLPSSSSHVKIITDLSTTAPRPRESTSTATSATPSPMPGPAPIETSAALPRNASSSSVPPQASNVASPATPVTATGPPASIGGGGPVPDGSRNQRESSSLQWATLDEILDKLLFVSVSGDDPVFIQHFFLTYRRFATPRSVLLGMQKRMRQLGQETRDPLLAKFAQMRICNLLSQWKENYPTDFGAPGTFGALSALLKQIVSNVHLVHYASDLLPFLDEVPKLVDKEVTWAKKDENVGDDSEDESFNGTDEEILPALDDDDETYVGKGKVFEKRTPVSSNPAPPPIQLPGDNKPYVSKASSSSAPNVATISNVPSLQPPKGVMSPAATDLLESFIAVDRPLTRSTKVSIRDLRTVAGQIIQNEPVHIAQEITRRMFVLFKKIEARDWLRRTLSSKGYDKEHDAIGQLGHMFNYLCCWVSAMIVAFDRPQARARVVDKMILIAKALRQLNNYMGMKALVAGINSVRGNDDEELTQLMVSKPNSNWKQFQSLHLLLGSARMGQAYRLALKHTVGPAIPDLERHGSDLLRTNEANRDYNAEGLIHWGKFTIMGKLVGTVTLYQNRCQTMPDYRDLEERPHISSLVFNQVVWDYDTLMNREARALEEAQTTESSSGIRRLLPSFRG